MELRSFLPSKYTWAGEQRKGSTCHITNSTDAIDHAKKAMGLEFFLAKPAPLPVEIQESISFIKKVGGETAMAFWNDQLQKVKQIVVHARETQLTWEAAFPLTGNAKPPSLRTVALLHLMKCFDLGGDRWIKQFIFWLPHCGGGRTDRGIPKG